MPIHPLSVVDPQADVHPEATVGPFCVVKGKVTIAAGAELRNHATVYGRTTIGAGSILFPGCVVGSDPQDLKYKGEDSEVVIGERVRIHECVTISKGTTNGGMKTAIGDDTLVMAYAHVGHDCIIDRQVVIANNVQMAGHVHVGRKAILSGLVGIHHFATIGEVTIVGAMSGIRNDLPPFMMCEGTPAEPRSINLIGLRRDGATEEQIRQIKDAFRVLFHDRANNPTPITESLAQVAATVPAGDTTSPLARLVAWQTRYLATNVRGRMLEAHRAPIVGGKATTTTTPA